jgi:hypothetical protein
MRCGERSPLSLRFTKRAVNNSCKFTSADRNYVNTRRRLRGQKMEEATILAIIKMMDVVNGATSSLNFNLPSCLRTHLSQYLRLMHAGRSSANFILHKSINVTVTFFMKESGETWVIIKVLEYI